MMDLAEKAKKCLPLTEATYYVLVSLVQPRHGYGIMQNIAAISGNQVRIGPGTLYGALNNLLKQGLIERSGEQELEGERRKIYDLTALGKKVVVLESERLQALALIGRRTMDMIGGSRSGEK